MEHIHKSIKWVMIASLFSHVFCCVLPTIVAVISIFSGIGMTSFTIPYFQNIHNVVHDYETLIFIFSAATLTLGWALQIYSNKIDCHSTGCVHKPCETKKKNSAKILIFSTILFAINVIIIALSSH